MASGATGTDDALEARYVVDIVIPVYNEEDDLEKSVRRLRSYLNESFPFLSVVTIADNASTDGTFEIATRLQETLAGVRVMRLDEKGRGRALRAAWSASTAEIVAYMDVDLSTDLDALLPLVAPLLSGHSHLSIGSRLACGARVVRGPKREVISRTYNLILRSVLRNRFSDAQCGFKALRRETAQRLLPLIEDNEWFFDTELLIAAERHGLRIHEVPVDWVDDPDSRVHIARTVVADLRGVRRLLRRDSSRNLCTEIAEQSQPQWDAEHLARYASVGVASSVLYFICFLLLLGHMSVFAANALAFAICTTGNMIATVRFTFGPRPTISLRKGMAAGLSFFALNTGLTSLTLAGASLIGWHSWGAQSAAVLAGTVTAAFIRFVSIRTWVSLAHARLAQAR